jgi:hypothetical protein
LLRNELFFDNYPCYDKDIERIKTNLPIKLF